MRVNHPHIKRVGPIIDIFQRIEIRAPLRHLNVLEPYIGNAQTNTVHYTALPCVCGLEGWEINPTAATQAKAIIPGAEVKHGDAYREVGRLGPHFDVIVIDNNMVQVPFEHFSLFPDIFKGLKDQSFLVVSVCPNPASYLDSRQGLLERIFGINSKVYHYDWNRAREKFYGIEADEKTPDGDISATDMMPIYMEKALKAGFFTKYQTTITRSKWLKFLLLELERTSDRNAKQEKARDAWARKDAGLC